VNVWLGRSQFNDPFFNGKYNEFRLWKGAMTPAQVAASFAAGPDTLPGPGPEPEGGIQSIALSGGNVVITFTGSIEQADSITGPWTPVTGASPLSMAISDKSAQFFRATPAAP
jgi:hypothetical protein